MKAHDLRRYLARARERFGDRLLTWLTLLLVVLTFVIVPLHAVGLIVTQGYVFAIVWSWRAVLSARRLALEP